MPLTVLSAFPMSTVRVKSANLSGVVSAPLNRTLKAISSPTAWIPPTGGDVNASSTLMSVIVTGGGSIGVAVLTAYSADPYPLTARSWNVCSTPAGTRWTAWGRGASSRFEGNADGLALDGDVTTFTLGADAAWSRWIAGVAVSLSEGEGGYRDGAGGADDRSSGELSSTLTAVHPYLRYEARDRVSLWGILGYGSGELELTVDGDDRLSTDISMRMAAAGARGVLVLAPESGGVEIAARTDAQLVRMRSDAVTGGSGNLAATEADTSRVRVLLEGSRGFALAEGTLTPRVEVGLRHDGGDAETGTGVEVGAGVSYAGSGIAVEAAVRGLLAHEDGAYEEWGASGSVRIDPDASGRGLALTLTPAWGAADGGAERLWSANDASALGSGGGSEAESRFDAELGYGFSVLGGRAVAIPHAGWSRAGEDETFRLGQSLRMGASEWTLESAFGAAERSYRAGYGWRLGDALGLGVEATRREAANDDAPEHAIGFRAALRW